MYLHTCRHTHTYTCTCMRMYFICNIDVLSIDTRKRIPHACNINEANLILFIGPRQLVILLLWTCLQSQTLHQENYLPSFIVSLSKALHVAPACLVLKEYFLSIVAVLSLSFHLSYPTCAAYLKGGSQEVDYLSLPPQKHLK